MVKISKNLKNIKHEIFLIRRLIEEGYGPRYWWPYIKNRFLGNYLFRGLPKYDYEADMDLEIHTICCKRDIWMLAWMIRSFVSISGLKPVVVIHEDGSIDQATAQLIYSKFPNTKIMFREETTKSILAMPDLPEIVKKARKEGHFFLDRLIGIFVFSKAKKIIVSDTDILYYKYPSEIMDFVIDKADCDAMVQRQIGDKIGFELVIDDFYASKYSLKDNQIVLLNGGYIVINKEKFNVGHLTEYLMHTKRPFSHYFIEMEGFACLLAQVNYKFLPPERYAFKGFLNDKMVMKHYTSPRRYEMFAYGIDKARQAIKTYHRKD